VIDANDSAKVRTLEWLSEMGFDLNTRENRAINQGPVVSNSSNPSLVQTAGAITICLLLLGYCVGVVLFPNLSF
jgi:hypothetical protein